MAWSIQEFFLPHNTSWSDMPAINGKRIATEAVIIGVLFFFARRLLTFYGLRPLSAQLKVVAGPRGQEEGIRRFCESCWRTIIYGALWFYGVQVLRDEQWFPESGDWLSLNAYGDSWPRGQLVTAALRRFYAVQLGFNLSMLVEHVLGDVTLSDYYVLLGHHVITVTLLSGGVLINAFRITLFTTLSTDLGAAFADLVKALNYARFRYGSLVAFLFLIVVYFVGRLVAFPYYLLYGAIHVVYVDGVSSPFFHVCVALFGALYVMQCYWATLIYRAAKRSFRPGAKLGTIDPRNDPDERSKSQ